MQLKKISRSAEHTLTTILHEENVRYKTMKREKNYKTKRDNRRNWCKLTHRAVMMATFFSGFTTAIYILIKCYAAQVRYRGVRKELPYKIHPGRIGSRPVAATSNVTKEQWRNNERPNTEIRHWKWNDEGVGFGAKLSLTAHQKHNESISSYRQNGQNSAKNPKPRFHFIIGTDL